MQIKYATIMAFAFASGTAFAQTQTRGAKINLSTDGTVVATINGSTFSWANQASATVTVNAGNTSATISQPAHVGTSNQAALTTVLPSEAACYTTGYQNNDIGSYYNSGMFLQNAATGQIVNMQDIYANDSSSNIYINSETNFQQAGQSTLYGSNGFPNFYAGIKFFMRICSDGTNVTFSASPTGAANSFQVYLTTTLSALGNPDHIGLYEDAAPAASGGETFNGTEYINSWQAYQNNTPQAAALGGDSTNGFIPTPNFPASDNSPVPARGTVATLPNGLSVSSGATYKAYYDFTPNGNTFNRARLDNEFYYQDISGNQRTNIGTDGIEGDSWITNPASNGTQPRVYPQSSASSLLHFSSNGLNTGTTCAVNNTSCSPGQLFGTLLRFPTQIQRGDIVHVRMQTGNSPLWYQAFVLYNGTMKTPGPGGDPYDPSLGTNPVYGPCYGENDILDGYWFNQNWAIGTSLKMGVVPVGSYAANSNGQCFKTPPYVSYAANGPTFAYTKAGSSQYITKPEWQIVNGTQTYSGFHDYVVELKNDGSNLINYYFDGYLVSTEYYEQGSGTPGWTLELTNQTAPGFPPASSQEGSIQPNNPINGGTYSATYQLIEVITGSVTGITQPLDTNGAARGGDPIGLN